MGNTAESSAHDAPKYFRRRRKTRSAAVMKSQISRREHLDLPLKPSGVVNRAVKNANARFFQKEKSTR